MEQTPLAQLTNLTGRVAVVTGGAMGIGYAIAYRLAEAGASVLIADRDEQASIQAAQALSQKGFTVAAVTADVGDSVQAEAVVAAAVTTFGGIDVLVNNAGVYPTVPLTQMDEETFMRVLNINLAGAFRVTKAAAHKMIEQGRGGRIINITSIDALHPSMVGLAAYDASKHGLWGFTKNVALELAPHSIWVNAIAPGGVATPGTGMAAATPQMADALKGISERIPMGRMAEADEIGKVALFLASDMASYMTGSQIVVDGGMLLK